MDGAHPEERLAFATGVAQLAVQPGRPLKERQFRRVLQPGVQEAGVQDPTPRQSHIRVQRREIPLRLVQRLRVAAEDRQFVTLLRPNQPSIQSFGQH
ncbi:hypothetical protein ACQEUX_32380 [Micromonospora sp. CA-259024]|uniref:hypothetical protein n=1 Tax=Micromonospora sp. CA-259024 TaxID=3239965 RepID=UPI003D92496A